MDRKAPRCAARVTGTNFATAFFDDRKLWPRATSIEGSLPGAHIQSGRRRAEALAPLNSAQNKRPACWRAVGLHRGDHEMVSAPCSHLAREQSVTERGATSACTDHRQIQNSALAAWPGSRGSGSRFLPAPPRGTVWTRWRVEAIDTGAW